MKNLCKTTLAFSALLNKKLANLQTSLYRRIKCLFKAIGGKNYCFALNNDVLIRVILEKFIVVIGKEFEFFFKCISSHISIGIVSNVLQI